MACHCVGYLDGDTLPRASMLPVAHEPPFLRFDFLSAAGGEPLAFADPVAVIVAERVSEVRPALRAIQEAVRARGFWAAGYIAYEAAPAFDSALRTHADVPGIPLVWFGLFRFPQAVPLN